MCAGGGSGTQTLDFRVIRCTREKKCNTNLPQGAGAVILEAVVPFVDILESTGETSTSAVK